MVILRRGASKVGCLFWALLAVVVVYFGFNLGEVYFRYYRFSDAFAQEARFAQQNSDDAIRLRLAAVADSLGLPEEASRVRVVRSGNRVRISGEYEEYVELPGMVRRITFRPEAVSGQ